MEVAVGGLQAIFMTTINSLLVLTLWLSNSRRELARERWKIVGSLSPLATRAQALSIVHELYLSLGTSVFLKPWDSKTQGRSLTAKPFWTLPAGIGGFQNVYCTNVNTRCGNIVFARCGIHRLTSVFAPRFGRMGAD